MQILTLIAHMCLCMPMSLCLSMAEMSSLHNILSHVLEQTYSFVVHNSTTNLGSATCSTCRPVRQGKVTQKEHFMKVKGSNLLIYIPAVTWKLYFA